MDFDIEERIYLKGLNYLDEETNEQILELIDRAGTGSNKHRARRLLDCPGSRGYKGYIAQIELVCERKHESNEDIKGE